jgi:Cu2+-exporting ATPase
VHGLGAATFVGWLIAGATWQTSLTYAIAVLIITCPCALALAVPAVQIAAASRLFGRRVIVKAADGLERAAEVDMVVFDKTGTLTFGNPVLLDADQLSDESLRRAASLAASSKHPYARAIVVAAAMRLKTVGTEDGVVEVSGHGLECTKDGARERLGSAGWCGVVSAGGGSEVWYRKNNEAAICFRFADALRKDAGDVVAALKRQGYSIALLSGDRGSVVETVAAELGIDRWMAEMKPGEKIAWLDARKAEGHKVLMVGDGLNDAPALAAAHASLSPATAADISQRAADFVFQGAKLAPVLETIATSKRARTMVLQNFGVAFVYNIVCVPLAMAGVVTPLMAAVVMATSSILVTLNASRLAGRRPS